MLDVIFYPYVQGRSGGERTFNREVDICKYTWEKTIRWMRATASSHPESTHMIEQNLSLLTVQPVLREEVERAVGRQRNLQGRAGDAGALRVLEENRGKPSRPDGGEMMRGLSETCGCFGWGTWQQHLGWLDI